MSPDDLLGLATLEGARALGIEDRVGTLEPGKDADFIAVNLRAPHLTPAGDPVAALFHAAVVGDVSLTVVAGQVLFRDGEFVTLDWPALKDAARKMTPDVS